MPSPHPCRTSLLRISSAFLAARATTPRAQAGSGVPAPPVGFAPRFPVVRVHSITLARGDATDLYFPEVPRQLDGRFTDTFPIVAVLQGALVDKSHYGRLGRLLAQQGFVVAIPNHLRTLPPFTSPVALTDVNVVTDVLARLTDCNGDPGSPLFRVVDSTRMGLVGHSLGGQVGLYAAAGRCVPNICDGDFERPDALRAAVFYGTSLLNRDGTLTKLDTTGVAVALIYGSRDGVAVPQATRLSFRALESPRALISIEGANHFAICDEDNPAGARPETSAPRLQQADAVGYVARWGGLWLRMHLKHDRIAQTWIERIGSSPDGVVRVIAD